MFYNCVRGNDLEGVRLEILEEKQYFNESAFFSNITDDFSSRAINHVTLYKLRRDAFYEIISENESDL